MKKLKKVLEKLEAAGMCVHVIDHSRLGDFGVPLARLVSNTHYVMQKNEIVHIGNEQTIRDFALRL